MRRPKLPLRPIILLIGAGFAHWLAAAEIPANGLAGFWRFDRLPGGVAPDLSPAGRPLRLEQPQTHPESGDARSLLCDGFETAGRLDETKPLELADGLTLAVWVWPGRAKSLAPLVGRPNANPNWTTPTTGLQLVEGRPVFGLFGRGGKLLLEGPPLPMRAWSLVAVTLDGRTARLWIDGRPAAEAPQSLALPPAGGVPWLVGRSATRYFQGRIGEVLLWSRPLAAGEMTALHAATASRYPASPPAAAPPWRDRTVLVASPGSQLTGSWVERGTRTLEGLDGFAPPPTPPAVDAWGGRLDRPARLATGFFRTEKIGNHWWLITPEGHLYFNVAVNSVRPPPGAKGVEPAAFAERATRELRELGFNGTGNGSLSQLTALPHPLPWCPRLDFAASFARQHGQTYPTSGHTGFNEDCIPIFHPDFEPWARRHAASLAATVKDSSILGIFTDNELQCPPDLLDRHLRLEATNPYFSPGRAAAEAWLTARGRPLDPARLTLRDRCEFIAHVFATYSRIVHDAVRAYDANHLILGSRFHIHATQFDNPWFWPAVGPWMDVVAVNYYGLWGPQREEIESWSTAMNRPVILTEWYAKALDAPGLSNARGAGWLVRTQDDRGRYYQHFVLAALETPALVGFHYFKYLDDPAESKALDSAGGSNKGLYNTRGEPWLPLTTRAQAVNRLAYPLIDFFDARQPIETSTPR